LKAQGEMGLLQVQETSLLDKHIEQLQNDMMRLSNFSAASFGENVGANTSGNAVGHVLLPTEKFVAKQQIHWTAFYQSINAKILKFTEKFGKAGGDFRLRASYLKLFYQKIRVPSTKNNMMTRMLLRFLMFRKKARLATEILPKKSGIKLRLVVINNKSMNAITPPKQRSPSLIKTPNLTKIILAVF
jgi:hypothetical protein